MDRGEPLGNQAAIRCSADLDPHRLERLTPAPTSITRTTPPTYHPHTPHQHSPSPLTKATSPLTHIHPTHIQSDSADYYVLVLSGLIQLTRGSQNHVLETAVPGSLIGFLFMMERERGGTLRDAALRAVEESRVLVISCDLAARIRRDHPELERFLNLAMFARAAAEARCAIRNHIVEDI